MIKLLKKYYVERNISDDWTAANAGKTGLWGEIYDFAVDYANTSVSDIYIMCIDI